MIVINIRWSFKTQTQAQPQTQIQVQTGFRPARAHTFSWSAVFVNRQKPKNAQKKTHRGGGLIVLVVVPRRRRHHEMPGTDVAIKLRVPDRYIIFGCFGALWNQTNRNAGMIGQNEKTDQPVHDVQLSLV